MKTKHLVLALAALLLAWIAASLPRAISRAREHSVLKKISVTLKTRSQQIVMAAEAFSRDRATNSTTLPATVPLRELITGGYLQEQSLPGIDPSQVTVSLLSPGIVDLTQATQALIRVRRSERYDVVLAYDGSVHLTSRSELNAPKQH